MYMIHHIFLPPKLPHKDDFFLEHETILLNTTINALGEFKKYITDDQNGIIDSVIGMVTNMRTMSDSFDTVGAVSEGKLGNALRNLCRKGEYKLHNSRSSFHCV